MKTRCQMQWHDRAHVISWIVLVLLAHSLPALGDDEPQPLARAAIPRNGAMPIVEVNAFGKKLNFAVDTVTPSTLIDTRWESRLGPPITGLPPELASQFSLYEMPKMDLAGISPTNAAIIVMDLAWVRRASGQAVDGAVGRDWLREHIVQFDFDSGELRFYSQVPPDAGEKRSLVEHPSGTPAIQLEISGQMRTALIGTAHSCAVSLDPSDFSELRPRPVSRNRKLLREVRLGPFIHPQVMVEEGQVTGIGLGYLSRFKVTIDYPAGEIYFSKGTRYEHVDHFDPIGIDLVWRNEDLAVEKVRVGSPAWDSGMLKGDVISQIDGTAVAGQTLPNLYRAMESKLSAVDFKIRRGRHEIAYSVLKPDKRPSGRRVSKNDMPADVEGGTRSPAILASLDCAKAGAPLVVPVTVGEESRPLRMLLDTGCGTCVYNSRLSDILGEQLPPVDVVMLFGRRSVPRWRSPAVSLGKLELLPTAECLSLDLERLLRPGVEIDGTLGMDALRRQIVRIDFDEGKVDLLDDVPADAGERLPLGFASWGVPTVQAALGDGSPRYFAIDTGWMGDGVLITDRDLDELKERHEFTHEGTAKDPEYPDWTGTVGRIDRLTVGTFQHQNPLVMTARSRALGLGYLSRYSIVLDFPGRAVHLKPGRRFQEPDKNSNVVAP